MCFWRLCGSIRRFRRILRDANGPDDICGETIGVDTKVWMSPWVMHRHRKFWDRPTAFLPDRSPGKPPRGRRRRPILPSARDRAFASACRSRCPRPRSSWRAAVAPQHQPAGRAARIACRPRRDMNRLTKPCFGWTRCEPGGAALGKRTMGSAPGHRVLATNDQRRSRQPIAASPIRVAMRASPRRVRSFLGARRDPPGVRNSLPPPHPEGGAVGDASRRMLREHTNGASYLDRLRHGDASHPGFGMSVCAGGLEVTSGQVRHEKSEFMRHFSGTAERASEFLLAARRRRERQGSAGELKARTSP